jgi:NAD(P)-dependent dehydrogenase (short-subunit alcohol dehydrogenase family)
MSVVWITGASSGIGAALARSAPAGARVVGVSRRPPPIGEHLPADLADPQAWATVGRHMDAQLSLRPASALLLHFAGALEPIGPADRAEHAAYASGVLLNSAAGQVLGVSFLHAARRHDVPATVVMCSSPAATAARAGASQYCAGKAALEQWARAVALEERERPATVFSVVPYGVDTPMVRGAMAASAEELPLGEVFRAAAAADRLADPESVALEIWALVARPPDPGSAVPVGAVPS